MRLSQETYMKIVKEDEERRLKDAATKEAARKAETDAARAKAAAKAAFREEKKAARSDAKGADEALRAAVADTTAKIARVRKIVAESEETKAKLLRGIEAKEADVNGVVRRISELEGELVSLKDDLVGRRMELSRLEDTMKDPGAAIGVDTAALTAVLDAADAAWEGATRSARAKRDRKTRSAARRLLAELGTPHPSDAQHDADADDPIFADMKSAPDATPGS